MGRSSTYSLDIAKAVCERLAAGQSLASICKDPDMPEAPTVRGWILDDREGFAALSARAYALGHEALAEECLQIADDTSIDPADKRIRIDTRIRLLGKWSKRYADKVQQEITLKRASAELGDDELAAIASSRSE